MKRRYPRDVFPAIWTSVDQMIDSGLLVSLDVVYEELDAYEGEDDLIDWMKQHKQAFAPLVEDVQLIAIEILKSHPTLIDLKKKKSSADPFVIACAEHLSGIVVTEEKPSGGPHKVKIPDVCARRSIECITFLDMIRREGVVL